MEDSFDDLLAKCDIPSPSKLAKVDQETNENLQKTKDGSKTGVDIKSHCVLVSSKQRGNALLKSITNIPWEFAEIVPDYIMGTTTCALYLSLRYHNLHPDYIHERLKLLGKTFELRVLLVMVDMKDPHNILKHLTRMCILADLTLMLAWSHEEAGKIIETYKMFENKPPDIIMERSEQYPHQKLVSALTSIKPVNQTDAMTILSAFGSIEEIMKTSEAKLSDCVGFGTRKATKLYKTLHEPFLKRPNDNSRTTRQKKKDNANEYTNVINMPEEDDTDICEILDKEGL